MNRDNQELDKKIEIDGAEYTQRELDVVREYCARKNSIFPSSLNEDINTYLATGKPPSFRVTTGEELKNFLNKVETLYSISCKWGRTHDYPQFALYREESSLTRILESLGDYDWRIDAPPKEKREWVTDSFKSFSSERRATSDFDRR